MLSQKNKSSDSVFSSNENKGLLWKTLSDNGLFNNIDVTKFSEVQRNFENTISDVISESFGINNNANSTITMNKIFIDKMIQNLEQFKQNQIITAEEIKKERQTQFENELETKQQEFNFMMKKDIPKNIDFSDKNKDIEEKLENIDSLLEEQQKRREKDLFADNNSEVSMKFPDNNNHGFSPEAKIHASNISTEINNNVLNQLLIKMDTILKNQEEIKELIRLRKKKATKPLNI